MPAGGDGGGPPRKIVAIGSDPAVGLAILLACPRREGRQLGHPHLPHPRLLVQAEVLGAAHVEGAVPAEAADVLVRLDGNSGGGADRLPLGHLVVLDPVDQAGVPQVEELEGRGELTTIGLGLLGGAESKNLVCH